MEKFFKSKILYYKLLNIPWLNNIQYSKIFYVQPFLDFFYNISNIHIFNIKMQLVFETMKF